MAGQLAKHWELYKYWSVEVPVGVFCELKQDVHVEGVFVQYRQGATQFWHVIWLFTVTLYVPNIFKKWWFNS